MSLKQIKVPGLSLYRKLSTKQKKTANMVLGGVASVIVVSLASWILSSSAPPAPTAAMENVTPAELSAPGSKNVDPQQFWMATERSRLDHIEDFVSKIKQERDSRIAGSPTGSANGSGTGSAGAQPEAPAPGASSPSSTSASAPAESQTPATAKAPTADGADQGGAGSGSGKGRPTAFPKQSQIAGTGGSAIPDPQRVNPNAPGANLGMTQYPPGSPNGSAVASVAPEISPPRAPVIISIKTGSGTGLSDKPGEGTKAPKWNASRNFLPVGFVRAKLLGGIDAATGGQSQSDPQPVLFLLQDDAVLPNGWRSKVRNCFVVGGGVGDISSERTFIRLINLSCVKHNGDVLEVTVKGSVFGEDGKNGMRGRLVTKQGQILANAAMSGIASGIGRGFGNQGTTISQSPLGVTSQQSQDAKTVLGNSVAQGFGSAMDRLAQYWIERADRMYPVIEIDAGRSVDLAFTKGVELEIMPGDEDAESVQAASGRNLDRSAEISTLFKDM